MSREHESEDARPVDSSAESGTVSPLSQDRIKALFDSRGWKWFVDNEGDLGGIWDGNSFYFLLVGPNKTILQILGNHNREIAIDRLDDVREFIRVWHRDKLWPKVSHRVADDGDLRVQTENIVDWERGATDAQLLQQIDCALGTAADFYGALEEELGL